MPVDDASTFCIACRLNRTLPDFDDPRQAVLMEVDRSGQARHLISQLLALDLPVESETDVCIKHKPLSRFALRG